MTSTFITNSSFVKSQGKVWFISLECDMSNEHKAADFEKYISLISVFLLLPCKSPISRGFTELNVNCQKIFFFEKLQELGAANAVSPGIPLMNNNCRLATEYGAPLVAEFEEPKPGCFAGPHPGIHSERVSRNHRIFSGRCFASSLVPRATVLTSIFGLLSPI